MTEQMELIALGEEAKRFLDSELGQFMVERAKLETDRAKEILATVDPHEIREITKQQNRIARHQDFQQWLMDVVHAGDVAYDEYVSGEE